MMKTLNNMQEEKIEVLIKVPKDWLETNELDILSMFGGRIRDKVKDKILDSAMEKIMKKIKLPNIKITPAEIKNRMLTILAERALENRNE